ncbi:MAG: sialidase family protein [Thermoplasmatota archaeon]
MRLFAAPVLALLVAARSAFARAKTRTTVMILLVVLVAGCLNAAPVAPSQMLLPPLPDFSKSVNVGPAGNEPVVRVAPDGTIYVAALANVYVSTDGGATFKATDFKGEIPVYASDSALAIAPDGRVYVTFDWPYAGETAVCTSADRGATWNCDPVALPGATDRMWAVAPTAKDALVVTGETLDRPTVLYTHDAGTTWNLGYYDWQTESQGADISWDPVAKLALQAASDANGAPILRELKLDGTLAQNLPLKLDDPRQVVSDAAGTWWAIACTSASGNCSPAVARSNDEGKTWNTTALPFVGKTQLLAEIAAGPANHIATAWYESNATSADDKTAEWRYVVERTTDGTHWTRTVLTPKPTHVGNMCEAVTCLGDARFAGDFSGLWVDDAGGVHAAWNQQDAPKVLPAGSGIEQYEHVEYARAG